MRGILVGLLFSNIVFLAWNFLAPGLAPIVVPRVSESVGSQSLQLLGEIDPMQLLPYSGRGELVENVDLARVESDGYCAEIGPFRSEEDAQGFVLTNSARMDLRLDVREVPSPPDYRVYLPPFGSRELAESTLTTLRAQFAANNLAIDTYLMSSGELSNGIALGLFSEQRNALNVQQQMEVLGYKVVVRSEQNQAEEVWLLATGLQSQEEFNQHWAQMRLSRSYVDTGEKLCETIAHAQ